MSGERVFGRRLRETRIRAGLSQSDLEEISGIPKARLSRYENGHVAPSIQTLERLARALGVSEASLLTDERAFIEEFVGVLQVRGVSIGSSEQAEVLGNAVADILDAFRAEGEAKEPSLDPSPAMASAMAHAREWLDGEAESSVRLERKG